MVSPRGLIFSQDLTHYRREEFAMVSKTHVTFLGVRIGRFLFLFISIILMMVLRPIMEDLIRLSILTDILFAAILISGLWAMSQRKGVFVTALLVAIPALGLEWVAYFMELPALRPLGRFFLAIFFGVTSVALFSHLLKAKEVTADLIMGAASAYLLIGLLWAFVFFFLETFSPGSFNIAGSRVDMDSQLIYYSFVTLTTVGYGDITAATTTARSLSVLEAAIGQLYLAVLVARLVGMHIVHSTEKKG
jgi:hypothetical protein